eukprot:997821-Prymnesium_polylepis.1
MIEDFMRLHTAECFANIGAALTVAAPPKRRTTAADTSLATNGRQTSRARPAASARPAARMWATPALRWRWSQPRPQRRAAAAARAAAARAAAAHH